MTIPTPIQNTFQGTPVSRTLIQAFDNLVKQSLRPSLIISDDRRQNLEVLAVNKVHALYVDNDKGIYNNVILIEFYNAAQNDFLNTRDLTRWVGITPPNFAASKLLSCNLQAADPSIIEMPPGIAYIQDIEIQIGDSKLANVQVPPANSGYCCLLETSHLLNVLTLGIANSWTNLARITALLDYYRLAILPDFAQPATQYIDILEKDFPLAINYIKKFIDGNYTDFKVLQEINEKENEIKES